MARPDEIMMCVGCYCLKSDDDAKRHCDAGCDGCSHSFEPFLEVDGELVPIEKNQQIDASDHCCSESFRYASETGAQGNDHPGNCVPETKGDRIIRLLHELGVEDLELPMICRPPGDLFSQTRAPPEDKCPGGCNNTGWEDGDRESGFICDNCDRACSCATHSKYSCLIHKYSIPRGY